MIYKIYSQFNCDFGKLLNKISKHFSSIYVNQTLFIALNSVDFKDETDNILKQIFKPAKNYYIEEINEKNVSKLPQEIKDWCLENFVRLDTEKFEKDQQENLKKVWNSMDRIEEELKEIQKNKKKGGTAVGQ